MIDTGEGRAAVGRAAGRGLAGVMAGGAVLALWAGSAVAQTYLDERTATRTLTTQGYSQVRVESASRREVVAVACVGDRQQRLLVDAQLRIQLLGDLGRCPTSGYGQGGAYGGETGGGQGGYAGQGDYTGQGGYEGQGGGDQGGYQGQGGYGGAYGATPTSVGDLARRLAEENYYAVDFAGAYQGVVCRRERAHAMTIYAYDDIQVHVGPEVGACRTTPQFEYGPRGFGGGQAAVAEIEDVFRAVERAGLHSPMLTPPSHFGACHSGTLYELRADTGYGASLTLSRVRQIGPCPAGGGSGSGGVGGGYEPPAGDVTPREARRILYDQGYRRIFTDNQVGDIYEISACFQVRRFEMRVDRAGRIISRRASGFCRLDDELVQIVAPRPISQEVMNSRLPLDPPTCQAVLNWFQTSAPITFESGSAELDARSREVIRRMALGVDRCGPVTILVEGHTDGLGDPVQNQRLSEDRASRVASLLVGYGVPHTRVRARGYGSAHPVASNVDQEERALNRRIELNLEWGLD